MTDAVALGGSAITSYHLQWNSGDGTDTFTDLVGQEGSDYASTSYLLVAGVVSGTTYKFQLRAKNKWGFGGFSASAEITASSTPGTAAAPTTVISGSNVRVSWVAPLDYGSVITSYQVTVATSASAFVEETVSCNGADAAIITALACEIPLATLRASPFSLAFDDTVSAKVVALNINGAGSASAAGGAARIQTEPGAMAAPARGSATTEV
jgi:hypothetical protein